MSATWMESKLGALIKITIFIVQLQIPQIIALSIQALSRHTCEQHFLWFHFSGFTSVAKTALEFQDISAVK